MSMRDFRQGILEQQIFDELKNTPIRSSEYFRKKYQGSDIDYSRLYRRIINYQIKEYGCSLNTNNYIPRKNREDLLHEHQRARQRKYNRRNRIYDKKD